MLFRCVTSIHEKPVVNKVSNLQNNTCISGSLVTVM